MSNDIYVYDRQNKKFYSGKESSTLAGILGIPKELIDASKEMHIETTDYIIGRGEYIKSTRGGKRAKTPNNFV